MYFICKLKDAAFVHIIEQSFDLKTLYVTQ